MMTVVVARRRAMTTGRKARRARRSWRRHAAELASVQLIMQHRSRRMTDGRVLLLHLLARVAPSGVGALLLLLLEVERGLVMAG